MNPLWKNWKSRKPVSTGHLTLMTTKAGINVADAQAEEVYAWEGKPVSTGQLTMTINADDDVADAQAEGQTPAKESGIGEGKPVSTGQLTMTINADDDVADAQAEGQTPAKESGIGEGKPVSTGSTESTSTTESGINADAQARYHDTLKGLAPRFSDVRHYNICSKCGYYKHGNSGPAAAACKVIRTDIRKVQIWSRRHPPLPLYITWTA